MAQASPNPSYVDVPRPNSSMITSDDGVAFFTMAAASSISAMNVEMPFSWWSPAPTRAHTASMTGRVAACHKKMPPPPPSHVPHTTGMHANAQPSTGQPTNQVSVSA